MGDFAAPPSTVDMVRASGGDGARREGVGRIGRLAGTVRWVGEALDVLERSG